MAVQVTLGTPLADQLSNVVQPMLAEIGWSTGGSDDSALAEYIILMLVNGKTQEQIAAELSNDLLNLGPDDSAATNFAKWLFEQVDVLNVGLKGGSGSSVPHDPQGQAIPSFSGQEQGRTSRRGSRQSGSTEGQDAEMSDPRDGPQDGNIPTGPKLMRNGRLNSSKRLMGQLSKAMDRSTDAMLHRVRPQQGTERISMHSRQPPKGPRGDIRNQRVNLNGRGIGAANSAMFHGGSGNSMMQMTTQQHMQLLAMYEEQARMMSQILSPQQQQIMMPGIAQVPAINPNFRHPESRPNLSAGRSLFERIEGKPSRSNGISSSPHQSNGRASQTKADGDIDMGSGDPSSSMEVESSQPNSTEISSGTPCRFNLSCTKKDCPFAHQSPAAPPGTTIDVNDHCPFGAACKNKKCVARHPSPAQKTSHQAEQDCKFFPNCINPTCPFRHPTMPVCRNGADCTRTDCKFTHIKITCKFNPCLNASCPYKHEEGQRRGIFHDKVWIADEGQEKGHVSERKFVDDDTAEEELIVPGNHTLGNHPSNFSAEVAI